MKRISLYQGNTPRTFRLRKVRNTATNNSSLIAKIRPSYFNFVPNVNPVGDGYSMSIDIYCKRVLSDSMLTLKFEELLSTPAKLYHTVLVKELFYKPVEEILPELWEAYLVELATLTFSDDGSEQSVTLEVDTYKSEIILNDELVKALVEEVV